MVNMSTARDHWLSDNTYSLNYDCLNLGLKEVLSTSVCCLHIQRICGPSKCFSCCILPILVLVQGVSQVGEGVSIFSGKWGRTPLHVLVQTSKTPFIHFYAEEMMTTGDIHWLIGNAVWQL